MLRSGDRLERRFPLEDGLGRFGVTQPDLSLKNLLDHDLMHVRRTGVDQLRRSSHQLDQPLLHEGGELELPPDQFLRVRQFLEIHIHPVPPEGEISDPYDFLEGLAFFSFFELLFTGAALSFSFFACC